MNLISEQIHRYKSDIHKCLAGILDQQTKTILDDLLYKKDNRGYSLTLLKNYNQSLRPSNIRTNLDDFNRIKSLYFLIEKSFKALDLNHDGAMYLTRFVERNKTLHLAQRIDDTRYVSLIAFIAYQYFQGHDILADILLQSVQSVKNTVQEYLKAQRLENYMKQNVSFHSVVQQTRSCLVLPLEELLLLAFNPNIEPEDCILRIRQLMTKQQLPIKHCSDNLDKMESSLNLDRDTAYFTALEIKSHILQNRVSGIIKSLHFTGELTLIKAITYFQCIDEILNKAPIEFLSTKEQKNVKDDRDNIRISLYKALLFLKVAEALKSGSLSLPYSCNGL